MKHQLSRLVVTAGIVSLIFALGTATVFAQQVTIQMNPVAGSGISGTSTLEAVDGQTMVTVTLSGMAPGSERQGHIHTGTCANLGPIVIPLPNIIAGADGTGTVTATVNASLASLQDGNHVVNFHEDISLVTALPGPTVSCGDIPLAAAAPAPVTPTVVPVAPTVLPATGGLPAPLLPVSLLGAALISIGIFLRRR